MGVPFRALCTKGTGPSAPYEQRCPTPQPAFNVQSRRDDLKVAQDVSPGYPHRNGVVPLGTAETGENRSAVPTGLVFSLNPTQD